MKFMKMHYTATEIALCIKKSPRYVKDRMKAGDFGPDVFLVDNEYVATAEACELFMEQHRVIIPGIPARTQGEFRRKLAAA